MTSKSLLTTPASEALRLLLTPRQAAEALAVSERTLWGMTYPRGQLRVIRLPGRGKSRSIRYAVHDLEAWIEAQN